MYTKNNRFIIIFFFVCLSSIHGHEQPMHQYITREAWQLLLLFYPQLQNSEMANFVGLTETNSNQSLLSMGDGKIVSGAWIEDEYDIVYHYGIGIEPTFNQSITPEIYDAFFETDEARRTSFTSITHFWDADNGFNSNVDLSDYLFGWIYWSYSIQENAYQKVFKYINGLYYLRLVYDTPTAHTGCGTIWGLMWEMYINNDLVDSYINNAVITSETYFAGES